MMISMNLAQLSGAASGAAGDTRSPHYQALKGRVHQELLNRLNLEKLTRVTRRDAEPEIRHLINSMVEAEAILRSKPEGLSKRLTAAEQQRLDDVWERE